MSLLSAFERYPLTYGPTPIEPLPRLSAELGSKVELWAKRDDCNSGLAGGGCVRQIPWRSLYTPSWNLCLTTEGVSQLAPRPAT